MKREIAQRLIAAVRAQSGPLPHVLTTATGRHCVLGLLDEMYVADNPFRYTRAQWAGTNDDELTWLMRLNDSSPKAAVVARLMEMAEPEKRYPEGKLR